jgi:hypothetical protein
MKGRRAQRHNAEEEIALVCLKPLLSNKKPAGGGSNEYLSSCDKILKPKKACVESNLVAALAGYVLVH